MKKYLFRFAAVGIATLIITSCGGNNKGESSNEANQEQVETIAIESNVATEANEEPISEEETTYQPPFYFIAYKTSSTDGGGREHRWVYAFTLKKNGMYEGQQYKETKEPNSETWEKQEYGASEDSGKWTITHRTVGEGYQKVYEIHINENLSYYFPDDGEYLYLDWDACSNFDTSKSYEAIKVAEIKRL